MCEFCIEHGEGKKWYLQMKNYAEELLHEELSAVQKSIVRASTRLEWNRRFVLESDLVKVLAGRDESHEDPQGDDPSQPELDESEIVARMKIEHFGQVLPLEDVEKVIDMVDSITRMPCGCRYVTTGKTDKRYCFGFAMDQMGLLGDYPDASLSLEVLGKEEAKQHFRRYDEEGKVHSIWTGVTPYASLLCNCDRDCIPYRESIVKRGVPSFFRAEYICRTDYDLCIGCEACVDQCRFDAIAYSSSLGKASIDPGKCYGCGVCRAACPSDAIELISRRKSPEAADIWLR